MTASKVEIWLIHLEKLPSKAFPGSLSIVAPNATAAIVPLNKRREEEDTVSLHVSFAQNRRTNNGTEDIFPLELGRSSVKHSGVISHLSGFCLFVFEWTSPFVLIGFNGLSTKCTCEIKPEDPENVLSGVSSYASMKCKDEGRNASSM